MASRSTIEESMSSFPLKLLGLVLVTAFVMTLPADAAKARKHKKVVTPTTVWSQDRGTNLVRGGPIYFGGVYLGDDPDPNIRFQIMRDISGRFGGDSN
jgi:hypothetical protein